jgi:thioredoxin-like negative regulator of GroEL
MTHKEVIEFSNTGSKASQAMEPILEAFLKENPDVSYMRVNYDEDPDLIKAIISSQAPTISPFFVSFKDGKAVGSAAGLVSKQDLETLTK